MVEHTCRTKTTAKHFASRRREKGFNATVYKKKKGYGVSVTRK
jgi:hypothetical protein